MSEHERTQLRCRRHRSGAHSERVEAVGEIDLLSSPRLAEVLREAQAEARSVVLDLGRTTFMDASGVRVLLDAEARARARAGSFSVVRPPALVLRLIRLVGVDRVLASAPALDGSRAGADGARGDPSAPARAARPAALRRSRSPTPDAGAVAPAGARRRRGGSR